MAAPGGAGIALVALLVLSLAAKAAPHEGSAEGAGAWGRDTAFVSGALPRASRGFCARCPRFAGRQQQGTVTHMGLRTQTYLHRARMSEAHGGSGSPPQAPGLVVPDEEPSVSLDETTEVPVSVAAPVEVTDEAPRMPMRRGRGIGKKEVIDPKPRSRPLDDGDLEELLDARTARASFTKAGKRRADRTVPEKAGKRRAERTVPETEPRRSLRERFLLSVDEAESGATGGASTASEGWGSS